MDTGSPYLRRRKRGQELNSLVMIASGYGLSPEKFTYELQTLHVHL